MRGGFLRARTGAIRAGVRQVCAGSQAEEQKAHAGKTLLVPRLPRALCLGQADESQGCKTTDLTLRDLSLQAATERVHVCIAAVQGLTARRT